MSELLLNWESVQEPKMLIELALNFTEKFRLGLISEMLQVTVYSSLDHLNIFVRDRDVEEISKQPTNHVCNKLHLGFRKGIIYIGLVSLHYKMPHLHLFATFT